MKEICCICNGHIKDKKFVDMLLRVEGNQRIEDFLKRFLKELESKQKKKKKIRNKP